VSFDVPSLGSVRNPLTAVAAAVVAGGLVLQLLLVPLVLLARSAWWGLALLPVAATTMPLWSLVHEAIHGTLSPDRTWNDRYGRALAVGYGSPFVLLKGGHLLHHRYSRTRKERTEVFDPTRTTKAREAPLYYLRLLGGLYLSEAASVLLAVLPRRAWRAVAVRWDSPDTVTRELLERVAARQLRPFRVDAALIVVLYTVALILYGHYWWMLLASVAARGLLVSLADNSYHYGTRLEASLEAMNLRAARIVELYLLAFNLHSVHHRHPGLRWHELRAAFVADGDRFHLGWVEAVARQFRGPIPDTDPAIRATDG
jgi:fatty acid desaturase